MTGPRHNKQLVPDWIAGKPVQTGNYMVTLLLANGLRTQAPCNLNGDRIAFWHGADAALIYHGARVVAHFALPAPHEG